MAESFGKNLSAASNSRAGGGSALAILAGGCLAGGSVRGGSWLPGEGSSVFLLLAIEMPTITRPITRAAPIADTANGSHGPPLRFRLNCRGGGGGRTVTSGLVGSA